MTVYENLLTQKEKATQPRSTLIVSQHNGEGKCYAEHLSFDNFLFKKLSYDTLNNQITLSAAQHTILVQFCLQGNHHLKNDRLQKSMVFGQAEYNIIAIPKGETILLAKEDAGCLIHIYLSEEFFYRYMPNDGSTPTPNLEAYGKLFFKNLYLSPKLKSILGEIESCEFGAHLKQLYTKAKLIELISLQLVQYEEEKLVPQTLKPIEIEKMILVKEMIEHNLSQPHSISSLARAAGTNEQYLKKHFKLLFGNTVFGHLISCKMQKAKEMLLTGKYRITEISEVVGYRHATHFTSAFKKFFGYLPQTLKTKVFFGGYFSLGFELECLEAFIMC